MLRVFLIEEFIEVNDDIIGAVHKTVIHRKGVDRRFGGCLSRSGGDQREFSVVVGLVSGAAAGSKAQTQG